MQRWTPQHARFVGRVIFANFLSLPLENYESIIEEIENQRVFKRLSGHGSDHKRNRPAILVRRLSRAKKFNDEKENRSSPAIAKIQRRGKRFSIRYACEEFNRMYVIDNTVRDELCADNSVRSMLFRLRRISSRNALTHALLKGIIEHQEAFLRSGDPIDLVPLSQVELTERMRNKEVIGHWPLVIGDKSQICHSWVSRLVNGLSIITPSGEGKPLKLFFQTQKDINKRLIKQLLDKESDDLQSGKLKKPYTDNKLRTLLEALLRERAAWPSHPCLRQDQRAPSSLPAPDPSGGQAGEFRVPRYSVSRHSVGHCRKDMGIPPAKRRLSSYKYPPLSANFSMLYPLTIEPVQSNTPAGPGVYEFRLKGQEIEYPKGKTKVIYIGSAKDLKKRIKEHLRTNNKNGHIRDFLRKFDCSFRYIQFSTNWKDEEGRLYSLFVTTYGAPPKCNRVRP